MGSLYGKSRGSYIPLPRREKRATFPGYVLILLHVFKLLLVAIGLVGQDHALPDREAAAVTELDTLALPDEHPEWVLARRAMASEGLCHLSAESPADRTSDVPADPSDDHSIVRLV